MRRFAIALVALSMVGCRRASQGVTADEWPIAVDPVDAALDVDETPPAPPPIGELVVPLDVKPNSNPGSVVGMGSETRYQIFADGYGVYVLASSSPRVSVKPVPTYALVERAHDGSGGTLERPSIPRDEDDLFPLAVDHDRIVALFWTDMGATPTGGIVLIDRSGARGPLLDAHDESFFGCHAVDAPRVYVDYRISPSGEAVRVFDWKARTVRRFAGPFDVVKAIATGANDVYIATESEVKRVSKTGTAVHPIPTMSREMRELDGDLVTCDGALRRFDRATDAPTVLDEDCSALDGDDRGIAWTSKSGTHALEAKSTTMLTLSPIAVDSPTLSPEWLYFLADDGVRRLPRR